MPDEGRELFVFKIFGEDLILELIFIFNNECIALVSPVDYVGVDGVLKDAVGFYDEVGDL